MENNYTKFQRFYDENGNEIHPYDANGKPLYDINNERTKTLVPKPVGYTELVNKSNVTSFADLQSYANGAIVEFPPFAEGQPFIARVRRPSMLVLAKSGKIPNSLLISAGALFSKGGGGIDPDNASMLSDIYDICEVIAKATLIEPTFDEIKNAGIELSDDQIMAIFNYSQGGVKALDSFRKE